MAKSYDPRRSSVSVGDDPKKRGLLPILLGLAALIVVLVVIGLVSCGGDDGDSGDAATPPSVSNTQTTSSPPDTGDGTLTAQGVSLLSSGASAVGQQVGQQATGTGVEVTSTTKDGFFVGTGAADRQYVEFGGDVGEDETSPAAYTPKAGDTVDLTGEVRPAPQDPGRTLRLDAADDKTVQQRKAFINADSVTPSGG